MLGGDLRDIDKWTLTVLTNEEVLAINQDPFGIPAHRISSQENQEVWIRDLSDGSKALAVLNRSAVSKMISFRLADVGLAGGAVARDCWDHRDLGIMEEGVELATPAHGSRLLRLSAIPR
jgi:alpha-galactosidase